MTSAGAASFTPETLVEALYEVLLGRPADPAGREAHAAAIRADGVAPTVRAFVDSAEFAESRRRGAWVVPRTSASCPSEREQDGVGEPTPSCLSHRRQTRIALIGNCVATTLARCLRTSPKLVLRWVADINFAALPAFRTALAAMLAGDADTIVSLRFGTDHPAVETETLRRTCRGRFRTVTNIFLSGLHPDITYLGSLGRRLHSPLTDYHSRIVLMAYLRGDSAADCVALFNPDVYARLGYFEEFDRSAAELRRRDEDIDIRFADHLIEMTRNEPTLLTNNHPTSATLAELAGTIGRSCGVETVFAPDGFENELLDHPIWPIYPEIGEALRLRYGTGFVFRAGQRQPALSLAEFVAGSYAMYDLQGRGELAAAAARAALDPEML